MPLFAPSHSNGHSDSLPRLFGPTPRYPTASETTGRQVTDSDVHETRRRACFDEPSLHPFATPHTPGADSWTQSLSYSRSSHVKSPPPLANDRYELAGGTEGMDRFVRHNDDYDDYLNLKHQRGMWSVPTSPPIGPQPQLAVDDFTTQNGAKPWMVNSIMNIVGGVAGKLFQFCTVPFRGFQAGGGKAYTFEANGEVAARLGLQDDPFFGHSARPIQQPLPGNFPEDDYGVLSIESIEDERPRMSKRQRTGDSWVVVEQDGAMISRPSTPRLSERRVPSHTRSPSQIPRPVSRAGASTPNVKRPSLIPISRRSTMDRRSLHGASNAATQSEATPRCYSRQSYGSPVLFENKTNKAKSPLPPESQRLINKMRREEFEDDARLRRMSSQMTDMLREAQEALGRKIEIDDGYLDDDMDGHSHSAKRRLYPR
ncbi:hypothetical protein K458DRAFT_442777 [Lentithecium fluviatile CBS 122367]|uniref:Uncharacterized protein n=1 Tax=Lentithecium fluviatile CBS 122367 TaxID=1168545 RepID=A0A6G1J1S5_9PLEO|nr:hypothetical protein K458DRAFT_442777 [Lentithecium fluviatile CBS 122367]